VLGDGRGVVLGQQGVVEDDVEFRSAKGDGGAGFAQLGICVLRAFVEADDAGGEDGGAFEVGGAALDVREADADGLETAVR
jgi:hypothetical protein